MLDQKAKDWMTHLPLLWTYSSRDLLEVLKDPKADNGGLLSMQFNSNDDNIRRVHAMPSQELNQRLQSMVGEAVRPIRLNSSN